MGRALPRRFGPPGPKRPGARRPAGPELRRCDGGALVARPGPGPPQSAGAKEAPAIMAPADRKKRPPVGAKAKWVAPSLAASALPG